jgi:hypothetical protein
MFIPLDPVATNYDPVIWTDIYNAGETIVTEMYVNQIVPNNLRKLWDSSRLVQHDPDATDKGYISYSSDGVTGTSSYEYAGTYTYNSEPYFSAAYSAGVANTGTGYYGYIEGGEPIHETFEGYTMENKFGWGDTSTASDVYTDTFGPGDLIWSDLAVQPVSFDPNQVYHITTQVKYTDADGSKVVETSPVTWKGPDETLIYP